MGVCGLFFFMVGYARVRNVLDQRSGSVDGATQAKKIQKAKRGVLRTERYLVAELCSDCWQKKKRSSLMDVVKAYFDAMVAPFALSCPGAGCPLRVLIVIS